MNKLLCIYMKLYKFRSLSKLSIEGLINNEVYFSSFEEFNDPFEFSNPMTDLSEYNKKARFEIQKLNEQGKFSKEDYFYLINMFREPNIKLKNERIKLLDKIEKGLPDFGVFCLSEVCDNILMWSHYAEEHKGFCIEFESLPNYFKEECLELKVNYINEYQDLSNPRFIMDFIFEMFSKSKKLNNKKWKSKYKKLSEVVRENEDTELGKSILRNKYADWSYEKEVRLVNNSVGVHAYDPISIKKIVFGLRISDSDKNTIKNICKSEDKLHIKFAQAIKKDGMFGIQIVDVINI